MKKVILASASPRRRELLEQVGMTFEVLPSQKEEIITSKVPEEIVRGLAKQKAYDVSKRVKDGDLIIGADTIVVLDGKIMGKPKDEQEAVEMISALQGNTHQVYTGVALLLPKEKEVHIFAACTSVKIYPMTAEEIRSYVQQGESCDKAGGYAVQGKFGIFIEEIQGEYNNVVGLPIARLYQKLKELGIELE